MTVARLDGMPDGVLGFRAGGKLTREDYIDGMMPALRAAAESGEMRVVYVIGPDFHGLDASAVVEDVKAGMELGVGHHAALRKLAMVTDVDWIRHAIQLLGFLAPGELRLYGLDELETATRWAAG